MTKLNTPISINGAHISTEISKAKDGKMLVIQTYEVTQEELDRKMMSLKAKFDSVDDAKVKLNDAINDLTPFASTEQEPEPEPEPVKEVEKAIKKTLKKSKR